MRHRIYFASKIPLFIVVGGVKIFRYFAIIYSPPLGFHTADEGYEASRAEV